MDGDYQPAQDATARRMPRCLTRPPMILPAGAFPTGRHHPLTTSMHHLIPLLRKRLSGGPQLGRENRGRTVLHAKCETNVCSPLRSSLRLRMIVHPKTYPEGHSQHRLFRHLPLQTSSRHPGRRTYESRRRERMYWALGFLPVLQAHRHQSRTPSHSRCTHHRQETTRWTRSENSPPTSRKFYVLRTAHPFPCVPTYHLIQLRGGKTTYGEDRW